MATIQDDPSPDLSGGEQHGQCRGATSDEEGSVNTTGEAKDSNGIGYDAELGDDPSPDSSGGEQHVQCRGATSDEERPVNNTKEAADSNGIGFYAELGVKRGVERIRQGVANFWSKWFTAKPAAEPVSNNLTKAKKALEKDENGILYFSSEEQFGFYKHIVKVFEPMTPILIRCEQDVKGLPTAKFFVLIVERSMRDTIIEDPKEGTGFLVGDTVTHLTERKDPFIVVYVRDDRSRTVPTGSRYCEELTRRVEENEHLIKQEHFFSVYSRFTDFQKNEIEKLIPLPVTNNTI